MDNKHWLFPDKEGDYQGKTYHRNKFSSAWGDACCGYEKVLKPPKMVKDIAYWVNHFISSDLQGQPNPFVCLNGAIEESTLHERAGKFLPHDAFIH